jgi:hypothetical protein
MVKILSKKQVLFINNNFYIAYYKGKIFIKNIITDKEKIIGKYYKNIFEVILSKFKITERLFRLRPRCVKQISEDEYLITGKKYIKIVNIKNFSIINEHKFRKGMNNTLSLFEVKDCKGFKKGYIYGEYWDNKYRRRVNIYRRNNEKHDWGIIYTFHTNEIYHIHGFCEDCINDRLFIFTGDKDNESGIWEARDDFKIVKPIIIGSQKVRICNGYIFNKKLIYASDTPLKKNFIYEFNFKNSIKPLYELNGPSIYSTINKNEILFSTTVEPDSRINNILYLITNKKGPGVNKNVVTLVIVKKNCIKKIFESKKDIFPMALFGFGAIIFPENMTSDIIICPQGVKKYDGKTLLIEL